MNQIKFWVLTSLSTLIVALLLANIFLARAALSQQAAYSQYQPGLNQGVAYYQNWQLLMRTIVAVNQKTPNDALKDLIEKDAIMANMQTATNPSSTAPAPAPAGTDSH